MNYISRKIGLCICAVQLIASAVFFVALWLMNLLPAKYVTIIGLVLLLFFVCVVSTQLLSKKKGIAGKVISILLSIGLIFGSYYIFKTTNVIENISGGDTKVTKMVVAVKESDRLKNWKMQHRISLVCSTHCSVRMWRQQLQISMRNWEARLRRGVWIRCRTGSSTSQRRSSGNYLQ